MAYETFAFVYDEVMDTSLYQRWLDFSIRHLQDKKPVLELACGTGALAVAFAKEGFEVTALDLSEEMLMSTSAHIHTLTERWEDGYSSSLRSYLFDDAPVWLACRHIKKSYGSAVDYYEYLKVFKNKELLIELKSLVPAQSA